jgi:hypothetical protein
MKTSCLQGEVITKKVEAKGSLMSKSDQKQIIAALLKRHRRTFASELGVNLESETPTTLFRWLCAALLFSARIGNAIAVEAARALTKSGWTTAKKMAGELGFFAQCVLRKIVLDDPEFHVA